VYFAFPDHLESALKYLKYKHPQELPSTAQCRRGLQVHQIRTWGVGYMPPRNRHHRLATEPRSPLLAPWMAVARATQGDAQCPLQPPSRVTELSPRLLRYQRRQRRRARAAPRPVGNLAMRRTATATRSATAEPDRVIGRLFCWHEGHSLLP